MHKTFFSKLMVILALVPSISMAQCGLVAAFTQLHCGDTWQQPPPFGSYIQLEVIAGTPPFEVLVAGAGSTGLIFQSMGTFQLDLPPFYLNNMGQFSIEDGNGCVTTNMPQQLPFTLSPGIVGVPEQYQGCPNDLCPPLYHDDGGILYQPNTGLANVRIGSMPHWWEFIDGSDFTLSGPVSMSGAITSLPFDATTAGCSCSPRVLPNLTAGTYTFTITNNGNRNIIYQGYPVEDCSPATGLTYQFTIPGVPFTLGDDGVNVTPQIALQGAMPSSGTLMDDDLRVAGLLPLVEPYTALGYSFIPSSSAGASIAQSILNLTGSNAIVDWVVVEIRSDDAPHGVLASRPALVQRDGDVVDLDGDQYVNFPGMAGGVYRVVVRHRNHLGIMQGYTTTYLHVIPTAVPLRGTGTALYGTQPTTTVNGVRCMWQGNTNFNGRISYTGAANDRDPILIAVGGSTPSNTTTGYAGTDVNMDGTIQYSGPGNDRDPILQNLGGSIPTAVRIQQLP